MRPRDAGPVARAELLIGALDGLIAIADQVEQGGLSPEVQIEGTSWFFTASTVERLGFDVAPPTWFGRLVPFLILLDITAMASFTRGRLTLPQITRVQRAITTGAQLLEHRPRLAALRRRLGRSLTLA